MIELAGKIGIAEANIAQDFLNKIPQTEIGRKIDSNPVTKAIGGFTGEMAKGTITGVRNASTLATGQNPYKGMKPTQAGGQAIQDVLNTAGLAYAPGKVAIKGAGLLPKIASGAISGGKVGGAFGGAYGLTDTMKAPEATPLDYAINTLGGTVAGAVGGAGLGVAMPLVGAGAKQGGKLVKKGVEKAVAGYKNNPILSSEAGRMGTPGQQSLVDGKKFNEKGHATLSNDNSSARIKTKKIGLNGEVVDAIELEAITSKKAGTGSATELLNQVKKFAEREGKRIVLKPVRTPKSAYPKYLQPEKPLSQSNLIKWYEKNGFVLNKNGSMISKPVKKTPPSLIGNEEGFIKLPNLTGKKPAGENPLLEEARQTNIRERAKYEEPIPAKIKNAVLRHGLTQAPQLRRADMKTGNYKDASKSLEWNFRRALNPEANTDFTIRQKQDTGSSMQDVMTNYQEGTKQQADFLNWLNMKQALEIRNKNGIDYMPSKTTEDLAQAVAAYEKFNPNALTDAKTIKSVFDGQIRRAVETGDLKPEALKIIDKYEFYTPKSVTASEDLIRPTISGGIKGTSGKQNVVQTLKGGDNPLDDSWQGILGKVAQNEKEIGNTRFFKQLYQQTQDGHTGGKIVRDPEIAAKNKALREELKGLVKDYGKLQRQVRQKVSDRKVARTIKQQREQVAASVARKEVLANIGKYRDTLAAQLGDDARAALRSLNTKELLDVFQAIAEDGSGRFELVRRTLAKRSKQHAALIEDISKLRSAMQDNLEQRKEVGQGISDTYQGVVRNGNIIRGRINGEQAEIELPIALAKDLDRAGQTVGRDLMRTVTEAPSRVFKTLFTGALAPVWTVVNAAVKNPVLLFVNSEGLTAYGVRPILQSIPAMLNKGKFGIRNLSQYGATHITATKGVYNQSLKAEFIGSRGSLGNAMRTITKHPVESVKVALNKIDEWMSMGDKQIRAQAAGGAYYKAIRQGKTEEEAMAIAARTFQEVLGDFNAITKAARNVEPLLLYSGATQAGLRSTLRSWRQRPVETAVKVTALVTAAGTLTANSMDAAEGFYQDMMDSENEYVLDNNIIIALPTADKDEETGEWTGIFKIPVVPDYRAVNRAVWREAWNMKKNGAIDVGNVAKEALNYATGDLPNNLNIYKNNPVSQTLRIMANNDPRTGKSIESEFMQNKENVADRKFPSTSKAAIGLSEALGSKISPLKVDKLLGQAGFVGDVIQGKDGGLGDAFAKGLEKQFAGAKGRSDGQVHYTNVDKAGKNLAEDSFRVYQSMFAKNSVKSPEDSAARAQSLLAYPDVLDAMSRYNDFQKQSGQEGDPFYELTKDRQQRVLRYRAAKDLNSAKQAYDKDGNPLFTALGLDEPWYAAYKDKEDALFDRIAKKGGTPSEMLTWSGAKKPKDPAMDALQDQYYKLPKGTGERKAFLAANPGLLEYWAASNQFTNAERIAMGLDVNTTSDGSSGSGYSKYARRGGGSKKAGFNKLGLKTASSSKISAPKGVKVKKLTPGKAKLSKQKVPKMPRVA